MNRRETTVLYPAPGQSSRPAFAAGYTVTAYPVGAVASATSSGTTITVDAGHSFRVGDKYLLRPGTSNVFSGTDTVQSVTATSIVMGSAVSVTAGDSLVNLGPDTGTTAPAYDGSPMVIYSDADGGTAISNSRVTTSATAEYGFWHKGDGKFWELIRDGDGTVVDVFRGSGGVAGRVNVCDYGAKGDGTTDDTAEIQAALDSGSYEVFVPDGTYIVTADAASDVRTQGGIAPNDNQHLRLSSGATIKISDASTGNGNAIRLTDKTNVRISGGAVDGNEDATTSTAHGIGVYAGSNIWISDIIIKDCPFDGINVRDSDGSDSTNGLHVRNVVVDNATRNGMSITEGKNITVGASTFKNTGGEAPEAGIDVEDTAGIVENLVIDGCVFEANAAAGVILSISDNGSNTIVISNNVSMDNVKEAFRIVVATTSPDAGVVVDGNASYNDGEASARPAVWVTSSSTGVSVKNNVVNSSKHIGIYVSSTCLECSVSGNDVFDAATEGIYIDGSDSISVVGNRVIRAGNTGIRLKDADNCVVSSNHVEASSQDTDDTSPNIQIGSSSANNLISGNVCRTGGEANEPSYGILLANTAAGNVVAGNDAGGKTGGIATSSSGVNTIRNNYDRNLDNFQDDDSVIAFTAADATPTVKGHRLFTTGGADTYTDFDDGDVGQEIMILAAHASTVTHNASIIVLKGAINFVMSAGNTLTLKMFTDQIWHEVGRSESSISSAYTITNVSADRAYDANATTTDELADVLGTLIADLKLRGILQ